LSILLAGVNPLNVNASSVYKVNAVLLDGLTGQGEYKVTVTTFSSGFPTLSKSKTIDAGYQICPDDVHSACYTPAGLFEFKASQVGKHTGLKICATGINSGDTNCKTYKQTEKWPPSLKVKAPANEVVYMYEE
jgi:hypothetical protein